MRGREIPDLPVARRVALEGEAREEEQPWRRKAEVQTEKGCVHE